MTKFAKFAIYYRIGPICALICCVEIFHPVLERKTVGLLKKFWIGNFKRPYLMKQYLNGKCSSFDLLFLFRVRYVNKIVFLVRFKNWILLFVSLFLYKWKYFFFMPKLRRISLNRSVYSLMYWFQFSLRLKDLFLAIHDVFCELNRL